MYLCYGAWLYTLLVMPLLILIFISILLDKIDRRNTNELTKMLDDASLPTTYYNEKIISCPKPVINSEKYASSYDLTKDIHNKNTDEIQSKLSKISDNIASQNPSILEFMEQEKSGFDNIDVKEDAFCKNEGIYYCHKCGTVLQSDCDFCHKCGTRIKYR